MTLHEAIEKVLEESERPLTAKAIATIINSNGYYTRGDSVPIESKQILSRVKNYNNIFEQINGQIILVEDFNWMNLLTGYWYIVNTVTGIYSPSDLQFIVAVLFFYKRFQDTSQQPGRRYPTASAERDISRIDRLFNLNHMWIQQRDELEEYGIAPEGIFRECEQLLSHLDDHKKKEIIDVISKIDTRRFDDKAFGNVFEYFLTLNSTGSSESALSPTPYSLRELMVNILAPESGKSLYDPVAGTGGLLIQAVQHAGDVYIDTKGTEINRRIAQFGNMNLIMHGIYNVKIDTGDCFGAINEDRRFDYIIADLPANGFTNSYEHAMVYDSYNLEPPKSGKSFGSLVLLVLSKLNRTGKAVITVSDGFLVKKGKEKQIRDLLIDEDVIESIISLPHGTLRPSTDAKASLLVLNKNKHPSLNYKIRFITAQAADQDSKSVYLNNEEIISSYKIGGNLSKDMHIITKADLREDSNLSAEGYDEQYILANLMLREGSGQLLSDLVTILPGIQPEKEDVDIMGDVPLVKIENLSRDILDTDLTTNIATKVYLTNKTQRALVNQKCILIARIGDNLKATIFNPGPEVSRIIIHSGVYALKPIDKKDSISIEYLYYQLYTSFVLEQVRKRKLGAVMPYVSIAGLKQIVIPFVDTPLQKSFIDSQKANLISEETNRLNERLRALGSKEEVRQSESDIVKTLTHQLRPTFMAVNSLANRVERTVERAGLMDFKEHENQPQDGMFDPEIAEHTQKPDNYSLKELLDKLLTDSEHISNILTTVDKVMNFRLLSSDLHRVDILAVIQNYKQLKEIEIAGRYNFVIKGDHATVSLNEPAFKELLDQLLINAEQHGFKEGIAGKQYRVQFTVRYVKHREIVVIEYTNNGAPYILQQRDFTAAFEKGRHSKGSGIGGNYIYRIVDAHGGKINVTENNSKGFSLIIELPIKTNHDNE